MTSTRPGETGPIVAEPGVTKVRNGIADWPHRGRVIWPHPRAPLLTFLETIPRMWSDR
jgi:hypothetical protein